MTKLANLFADGGPLKIPFVDVTAAEARSGCTFNVELPRQVRCAQCGGIGVEPGTPDGCCDHCDGEGLVTEDELVTVTIPPHTPPGTVLTLRGQGDEHRDPAHGQGDLAIGVRIDGVFHPPEQAPQLSQQAPAHWLGIALVAGLLAAAVVLAWIRFL